MAVSRKGLFMRQMLHTLFITEEDAELHLKKESLVILQKGTAVAQLPLINLENVISFSYLTPSIQLITELCNRQINFAVLSRCGKLKFRTVGETRGNPKLRFCQYNVFFNQNERIATAKIIIKSKLKSCTVFLKRFLKNHSFLKEQINNSIMLLNNCIVEIDTCSSNDEIRGIEGTAARIYYSNFDNMILSNDTALKFIRRSKRPPENNFNALLSLCYTVVTEMCKSALETVGLDPYFGVLHETKSGNATLAFDIVEEFRALICDRFVFRLINLKMLTAEDFEYENKIYLTKNGLKKFFVEWNKYIAQEVKINSEVEKLPIGLLPYYRALQYSRFIYGKCDALKPLEVHIL